MTFVSVITPTYNRRKFIPILIEIYKNQIYPKEKMEWIILDDGSDKVEDLFAEASKTIPNIRYIYSPEKKLIGAKRNMLNKEAKGQIIVAMDDDDYYPPARVSTVVNSFAKFPSVDLAGSSEMYMYYIDTQIICKVGPYNNNHATNGTLAYRKSYAKIHKYDETVTHAEEASFLEKYKNPMIQLDPHKTILVLCHTSNTFDKKPLRDKGNNKLFKTTSLKLKNIIKDKFIRDFYSNLNESK